MTTSISTKSTSANTAVGEDIVLRETTKSRLVFRPLLVENPHDPRLCVKGDFIYQSKKPSGQWQDYKTLDLSRLKDAEWIKLSLHSAELFKLITELDNYYGIFKKYGIRFGERQFVLTDSNVRPLLDQVLSNKENFRKLLSVGGPEILEKLFAWIGVTGETGLVIDKLLRLNIDSLKKINSLIGVSNLKKLMEIWGRNKRNSDEAFWQKTIAQHAWAISQVFSHPVVILKEKAYIGGKAIDNTRGNVVDFLYRNKITSNIILIEIKTPMTRLAGQHYRGNAFSMSPDLSGSVNQALTYKDEMQKSFYALSHSSGNQFQSFNPQSLIVVGSFENESLGTAGKRSFELFRNDLKNVQIITFDELFEKISLLLKLLETDESQNGGSHTSA
jgi:hypothetical protein